MREAHDLFRQQWRCSLCSGSFPTKQHMASHLILLMMKRLGLSGSTLDIVKDIYSQSTIAIRTGREGHLHARHCAEQGCQAGVPTEPHTLQHCVGGAPDAPSHQRSRDPTGRVHHQFLLLRGLTLELRRATLVTKMKRLRSAEGDFSRRAGLFKYFNGIRGQS